MYQPRCPECDIELDCTTDRWRCPMCGQVPRPEQYVHSPTRVVVPDQTALRDRATEAAALLIELAMEEPCLREQLAKPYRMLVETAERADQG